MGGAAKRNRIDESPRCWSGAFVWKDLLALRTNECIIETENPLTSYGGYILHLPDPVSGRCCDMSYYEFIFALILVTGYIICVKKK